MYNKIINWWKTLIYEEYHITFWFPAADWEKPKPVTYKVKSVKKLTSKHFVGIDLKGKRIEIKTVEPFDYRIVKKY